LSLEVFLLNYLADDASQRKAAMEAQIASGVPISTSDGSGRTGERRQAVFSLDYDMWQDLIEVLGIVEPLISDRTAQEQAATQVAAHGWYN